VENPVASTALEQPCLRYGSIEFYRWVIDEKILIDKKIFLR
jgi:hypothetical protein